MLAKDKEVSCQEAAGEFDGTEGGSGNRSVDDSSRSFWKEKDEQAGFGCDCLGHSGLCIPR